LAPYPTDRLRELAVNGGGTHARRTHEPISAFKETQEMFWIAFIAVLAGIVRALQAFGPV